MMFLRQSTAVDIGIGPFVDATDGVTAETGLTLSQADFRLKKNNGAWAQVNDATSATHEENGWYEKELDATDTNTVGILLIAVAESGALPVWQEYTVLEEAVYDALFASAALGYVANAPVSVAQFGGTNGTFAGGRPEVNVSHAGGTAITATGGRMEVNVSHVAGSSLATLTGAYPALGIAESGTMQAGSTGTTAVLRAATSFGNDNPNGFTIWITGGTGVGQSRLITDWVSASDTATVDTWTVTPDNTSTYIVYPTAPSSGGSAPSAATVAAAVWDKLQADHVTAGSFGELATEIAAILVDTGTTLQGVVDTIQADTDDIQARLPAALVGGRIDANTGAISGDAVAADNLEAALDGTGGVTLTTAITGNITGNLSGSVGSVTGNVGGNVAGSVGSLTTNNDKTGYALSAAGVDAILDEPITEPSGVFAWASATLRNIIAYVGAKASNRQTETATTYTLRNRANSADIATSTNSDDGTTTVKGSDA